MHYPLIWQLSSSTRLSLFSLGSIEIQGLTSISNTFKLYQKITLLTSLSCIWVAFQAGKLYFKATVFITFLSSPTLGWLYYLKSNDHEMNLSKAIPLGKVAWCSDTKAQVSKSHRPWMASYLWPILATFPWADLVPFIIKMRIQVYNSLSRTELRCVSKLFIFILERWNVAYAIVCPITPAGSKAIPHSKYH